MQQVKQATPLDIVRQVPAIDALCKGNNHVDVKTITGDVNLREFLAGLITYSPSWLKFLYRVRKVFVRFLGMKQEGIPEYPTVRPETISFTKGDKFGFFDVVSAEEDHHYLVGARDSHLTAYLGVVREAISADENRYYLATIVHYHNWAGPIYFNVIRPFHHMVVKAMAKAGVNYSQTT